MESQILVESRSSKFFKFENFPEDGSKNLSRNIRKKFLKMESQILVESRSSKFFKLEKFEPKAVARKVANRWRGHFCFLKMPTDSATS